MKMEIELPTDDVTEVEFEYIKIEKHCFTCYSLFHEETDCPQRPRNALPPKERVLGITQNIALQRIEAEKRRHDDRRGYRRTDDLRSIIKPNTDSYLPRRDRATSRSYYTQSNDQRGQSILSRTARSNSGSYRHDAPSVQYRVVDKSRHSSGSSGFHHNTETRAVRAVGTEITGTIPIPQMKLQSLNLVHYFSVPPVGLSGGLSLFWNDDSDITILESSPNLVDTKITHKGVTSFVSFVYGTPAAENIASFWNKLTTVGHGRDSPWLITGDFNDILNNAEKVGGPARPEGSFTAFRSFVSQNGLWDLKHSGEQLSWRGNRYTHFIRSRLDRSMGNCSWAEAFPMGRCRYLRFEGSDHRPLMSYFNADRPRRRGMFRFNRLLTEQEEVTEVIAESWNHSPLDSVIQKLNECRRGIIKWAKEQQAQSNLIIQRTQVSLEAALSNDTPDPTLIEELNSTLRKAYITEEQFWQQRSRTQWLKQGDRNTGFFHAATRTRRTINSIPVIEDAQGGVVYEEQDITRRDERSRTMSLSRMKRSTICELQRQNNVAQWL
ncbi:hypothetical protein Bca52824_054867 [Brassica carinata]|uniref:Endonuclease/exonuclease/phosphatase domain-containing protein n=1 Tax=Brassica carinata TaxID=52824 RepID=A0A8X7R9I4_BRACI|nr:hypothetical protein Bca52824_054867 [Brassica carinata]